MSSGAFEQALARVSGDPTRGLSRDPASLRRTYDQHRAALPFLRATGPIIQADAASPEALAEEITTRLRTGD